MTDSTAGSPSPAGHALTGQADTATTARRSRRRATGRDRRHVTPGRPRQVKIRYTENEYATLVAAAGLAGLTPTGYAGEAALAAARQMTPPSTAPWRLALAELMVARGQVRRFGRNVNQAARTLNALGEAPEWLAAAIAITERAVTRLDHAAATVAAVARADRTVGRRPRAIMSAESDGEASHTGQSSGPVTGQPAHIAGQAMAGKHDSNLLGHRAARPDGEGAEEGAA